MKRIGLLFAFGLLAAGASTTAMAHTHTHVVVGIGPAWGYPSPYYYPNYYPNYYPAPVVVVPSAPTTYIEATPPAAAEAAPTPGASNMWYYCSKPDGYYPYVKQCPGGWRTVAPQPPAN